MMQINEADQNHENFCERLPQGVELEMVAIPAGVFLMGSPEDEPERRVSESPQHQVTIPKFFMGKYPITQTQWLVIASLPEAKGKLDPVPSHFKGANLPVEQVSWKAAETFCMVLSGYTSRPYRLPSEAEWEYACRAGTTTPFHFGENLTIDLANYNGVSDQEKRGCRLKTTEVNRFPPNAFGLYDLHGNVLEWCLDTWHETYEDAPNDGSAWLTTEYLPLRSQRGGAWNLTREHCRSAARRRTYPNNQAFNQGFRVVCSAFEPVSKS